MSDYIKSLEDSNEQLQHRIDDLILSHKSQRNFLRKQIREERKNKFFFEVGVINVANTDNTFPLHTSFNMFPISREISEYLVSGCNSFLGSRYHVVKESFPKEKLYVRLRSTNVSPDPIVFFSKTRVTPYLQIAKEKEFATIENIKFFNLLKRSVKNYLYAFSTYPVDKVMRKFHNK